MKKNVALVLGSGGARGMAHIGVINELLRQGYNITSISGASIGALVGGIYATGNLKVFEEWMISLNKMDVFNLIDFTLSLNGVVKGDKILNRMKKMISDRNIETLSIPYTAVATDIINGKEVVFNEGSLYDAIRASISIPSVFTPFSYNGTKLVDGGVLNPVPVNRIKRQKDDILVVVDLNANKEFISANAEGKNKKGKKQHKYLDKIQKVLNQKFPKNKEDKIGYYNLLINTTGLMVQKISELTLKNHKPDILIEIPYNSFGTYEFYNSKEIIEYGKAETQKALEKLSL